MVDSCRSFCDTTHKHCTNSDQYHHGATMVSKLLHNWHILFLRLSYIPWHCQMAMYSGNCEHHMDATHQSLHSVDKTVAQVDCALRNCRFANHFGQLQQPLYDQTMQRHGSHIGCVAMNDLLAHTPVNWMLCRMFDDVDDMMIRFQQLLSCLNTLMMNETFFYVLFVYVNRVKENPIYFSIIYF